MDATTLIPDLGGREGGYIAACRSAVSSIPPDWGVNRAARSIVDRAIEDIQDTARENYINQLSESTEPETWPDGEQVEKVIAQALDGARAFFVEETETLLGPHGRGWRDSGPKPAEDCYGIMWAACRRTALDALSGPDASGYFTQAFVDRYNRAAEAREGGF